MLGIYVNKLKYIIFQKIYRGQASISLISECPVFSQKEFLAPPGPGGYAIYNGKAPPGRETKGSKMQRNK